MIGETILPRQSASTLLRVDNQPRQFFRPEVDHVDQALDDLAQMLSVVLIGMPWFPRCVVESADCRPLYPGRG